MDFFHCMRCCHWPVFQPENRMRYYFSMCGRLCCENCVNALNNKCMCGQEQCKLVEVQQQSGSDVKAFFQDPMSLLQEALKKPARVIQFQNGLQKNCMRIVGKLVTSSKAQIASLKAENDHFRQVNEQLKKQVEQLSGKLQQMSQANAAANSFLNNSIQNSGRQTMNSSSDPLNLFREVSPRPNAQVAPNEHLQHRSLPVTPAGYSFPGNRGSQFPNSAGFMMPTTSPAPSASSKSSQQHQFPGLAPSLSIPRSVNVSPAFATPASSISQLSGLSSNGAPFSYSRINGSGGGGVGSFLRREESTPEIITRLRSMKCRATPSGSPQDFRP